MRILFARVSWMALIILTVVPVRAQTTGNIAGTVTDESKAVLPGVTIGVTNMETNAQRSALSDDQGRYQVPDLNPGVYSVTAELAGFKTTVRSGIEISIGREAKVDVMLTVGEISEKVVVTGDAPLIETGSGTLGGLVSQEQVKDLPLNGRSFQDLMGLQPGVVLVSKATSDISRGMGNKFSVSGARYSFNQFLVDGGELNDHRDSTPASVAGIVMGVEAVREFKVLTNSYSAEYGRNAGVVMSVVTKSGTNRFHGSVYEFHRNSALDARNFFTQGPDLPFKRNQFGAAMDGPVFKDRTFFMVNYEGLRQRLEAPRIYLTLDAQARQGLLPGRAPINISPAFKPYIELYPLPTPGGRAFTNGTAEFITSLRNPVNQDYFIVRIDHQLSESTSLLGRYSFDEGESVQTNTSFNLFGSRGVTQSHNLVLQGKSIFSPRLLNTVMFALNRPKLSDGGQQIGNVSPRSPIEGRTKFAKGFNVNGLSSLGDADDQSQQQTLIDIGDSMVFTPGRHSLKFGGSFKRFYYLDVSVADLGGEWQFASIEDLLNNRASEVLTLASGFDPTSDLRQNLAGFYVQDDLTVSGRLTLNLGLRYEFVTLPNEVNGKYSNLRSLYDRQLSLGKPLFENPSFKNFAPRFGFAWDLFGDGKSALRGGFGIFHGQLLPRTYERAFRRMPPFYNQVILSPAPPVPISRAQAEGLQGQPLNLIELQPFEFHPSSTYMMQYNLSLQREILPSTVVNAAYVGSRGLHLTRATLWNIPTPEIRDGKKFFAANLPRRNPAFSRIRYFDTAGNSAYNSLQLGVGKRLAQGFQMQANYSFSRAIDNASETQGAAYRGGQVIPQDPDNPKDSRSLSDFHTQHTFVFNTSYELPWGSGWTGWAGGMARGWQLGSIVRLAAGPPYIIELGFDRARTRENAGQRPNVRPGYSNNPVLGGPDRYFDVNAFELQPAGFFGDLGRNTLMGPGIATVDFSLMKSVAVPSVSENFNVQFRAEFFNLFNRPNFSGPQPEGSGGVRPLNRQGERIASAAQLTKTATTSRQIQLALKILF